MTQTIDWPRKSREFKVPQMDSRIWNEVAFRDDDIIVASYAKAGTTWTQQIVAELVLGGDDVDVQAISPWVDSRTRPVPEQLAVIGAQTHRRFLKTHLPADAMIVLPNVRYIYVARDGRDVVWSMHNHHLQLKDSVYALFNADLDPGMAPFPRPDPDIHRYFRDWLANDGWPWWPFWENVRSWWALRRLPNVKLVHFNDLKRDLPGSIEAIAEFLGVPQSPRQLRETNERCSFEYMQRHAARFAPRGGQGLLGGAQSFIHKGTNGRWRDVLTSDDIASYEAEAVSQLGTDCAAWLKDGGGT